MKTQIESENKNSIVTYIHYRNSTSKNNCEFVRTDQNCFGII